MMLFKQKLIVKCWNVLGKTFVQDYELSKNLIIEDEYFYQKAT